MTLAQLPRVRLVDGTAYDVTAPGYAGLMDALRSARETGDPVVSFAYETGGFKPATMVATVFVDKIVTVEYAGEAA